MNHFKKFFRHFDTCMNAKLKILCISAAALLGGNASMAAPIYVSWETSYAFSTEVYLDLNLNGTNDTLLSVYGTGDVFFNGGVGSSPTSPAISIVNLFIQPGLYNPALRFGSGATLPPGDPSIANTSALHYLDVHGGTGRVFGNFGGTRGYAGFRYDAYTPTYIFLASYYGWMDLSIDTTSSSNRLTVHGWAIESSPFTAITAGAGAGSGGGGTSVPDDALTVALLSLALLGLAAFRRRFAA